MRQWSLIFASLFMAPGLAAFAADSGAPDTNSNRVRQKLGQALAEKNAGQIKDSVQVLAGMGATLSAESQQRLLPFISADLAKALSEQFSRNAKAQTASTPFLKVPARFGLIEGVATASGSSALFASSASHGRLLWQSKGAWREARPPMPVDGLFGMAVDPKRNRLLVTAGAAQPEKAGKGWRGLLVWDLRGNRFVKQLVAPQGTNPGDVAVLDDGTILVSDSGGRLLKAGPDSETLSEIKLTKPLRSPQGIVPLASGRAIVADYVEGLVLVDVATGNWMPIAAQTPMMLEGIDGLTQLADGQLMAIQNGTRPKRILAIRLNAAKSAIISLTVIEQAAWPEGEPTLAVLTNAGLAYVGNAQWFRMEENCDPVATCAWADTELRLIPAKDLAGPARK